MPSEEVTSTTYRTWGLGDEAVVCCTMEAVEMAMVGDVRDDGLMAESQRLYRRGTWTHVEFGAPREHTNDGKRRQVRVAEVVQMGMFLIKLASNYAVYHLGASSRDRMNSLLSGSPAGRARERTTAADAFETEAPSLGQA